MPSSQPLGTISGVEWLPSARAAGPWTPHAYQLKAVRHALERGSAGLLLDPGLGKTSIMLAVQQVLRQTGQGGPMLVLAPLRPARLVWPAEWQKWADFHHLTLVVLHGKDKDRLLRQRADVYVLNYEGLEWFTQAGGLQSTGVTTLVCDESTRLKNSQSKRFKLLRQHLNTFTRRYILTGTPRPKHIEDLWAQVFLLDGGLALGRYITHFRNTYTHVPNPHNPYERSLNPGAEEEIHDAIRPYMLRMAAEDYLEMPELTYNNIVVQLPEEARRVYTELYNNFIAILEEDRGPIVANNAAVAGNKCLQVTGGALYTQHPEWTPLHDAKLDALVDHVGGLTNPTLILYAFDHERERILAALKDYDGAYIGKGVNAKQEQQRVDAFNRGDLTWLLAQFSSIGHGVNLQEVAGHVTCYGVPWDLEFYDQAIKRVYRQGNPNARVFVHHIVAEDTIDYRVLRVLASKERGQAALFRAMVE